MNIGVPITIRALKEGVSPQQIVDKYHAMIKEGFEQMGISFDIYSRTTHKIHHQTAADFFKKLYDDGLFEEKETEQYYDEKAKTFLADALEISGSLKSRRTGVANFASLSWKCVRLRCTRREATAAGAYVE